MLLNFLVFFAVLSLLIFFHELGHFLAAKSFGIYVKRFSIGMPPRLLGFQWGETDYCIGALPIGGFVMMAGQEDVPLTDEEREKEYGQVPEDRWFKNKPVWQRMCVLLAGPIMNLILAVVLYGLVGLVGSYVPEWEVEARIGEIEENSPAVDAPMYLVENGVVPSFDGEPDAVGWEIGDRILQINGREVGNMTDLAITAVLGGEGKQHHILLERETPDGDALRYVSPVAPRVLDKSGHARFGVAPYETAVVRGVRSGSAAEQAGFLEGDVLVGVNGAPTTLSAFISQIEAAPEGDSVDIEILRNGERMHMQATPATIGRMRSLVIGEDDKRGRATIRFIDPQLADSTPLRVGDVIVEIQGQPATPELVREAEESTPGGKLEFRIERPARLFGLLQASSTFMAAVEVEPVRAIGVALRPRTVLQRVPVLRLPGHAVYQSYLAVERTVMTIVGLATRTVSPKDLGGPVMIFEVTTRAAQAGLDWLIKITAFISVNLFILNLLPLPALDGGQVVMNAIEAARGKPINELVLERVQQIGIAMLLALMLFVTYNDISRLLFGWL